MKAGAATSAAVTPDTFKADSPSVYTLADLRPGKLLLLEFSRPGGSKSEEEDSDDFEASGKKNKKKKEIDGDKSVKTIERMTLKIVNHAYAKLVVLFPHTPFGIFCEEQHVPRAYEALKEVQQAAAMTNRIAEESGVARRVRIDIYPITLDHNDPKFRKRLGEMIAEKLIELREAYTSKLMWAYRVRYDRARNLEMLVTGRQAELIHDALESTRAQRKVMVAIYGDKCPVEWTDVSTGELKEDIRLDFTAIDRAIKHFCPTWVAPEEALPF